MGVSSQGSDKTPCQQNEGGDVNHARGDVLAHILLPTGTPQHSGAANPLFNVSLFQPVGLQSSIQANTAISTLLAQQRLLQQMLQSSLPTLSGLSNGLACSQPFSTGMPGSLYYGGAPSTIPSSPTSSDRTDRADPSSTDQRGKRNAPFGRRSGDAAQLRRQARQKERRRQIGDLWSKLDAMLPSTEPPRARRGGVISRSLQSGRSKDELLALVVKAVREKLSQQSASEVRICDRNAISGASAVGLIAIHLETGAVVHASKAFNSFAEWLHPEGLEGHSIAPLLHEEDADALSSLFDDIKCNGYQVRLMHSNKKTQTADDIKAAAPVHPFSRLTRLDPQGPDDCKAKEPQSERRIQLRLLHRIPSGPGVRAPGRMLQFTRPLTMVLTSVSLSNEGLVGVFMADLKIDELAAGSYAKYERSVFDSPVLACEYDIEWKSPDPDAAAAVSSLLLGSLARADGHATRSIRDNISFDFSSSDELRCVHRTHLEFSDGGSADFVRPCHFWRTEGPGASGTYDALFFVAEQADLLDSSKLSSTDDVSAPSTRVSLEAVQLQVGSGRAHTTWAKWKWTLEGVSISLGGFRTGSSASGRRVAMGKVASQKIGGGDCAPGDMDGSLAVKATGQKAPRVDSKRKEEE